MSQPSGAPADQTGRWSAPSALAGTLLLLLVLVPLYATTVVTGPEVNVDAEAAALPAWQLARHGTQDLGDVDLHDRPNLALALDRNPWISRSPDGRAFSNRPPGLWILAVPAYLLFGSDDYSAGPATATALLLTVAAVLVLHQVLRRCLPPWWALFGAAVLALGTSTWPMSAAQLWPHGPGQLLFALALLAASSDRQALSGLAMGAEVLVRPVTIVVPAAVAAGHAIKRRWRQALWLGIPAVVGLLAVVTYNGLTFGRYSLSGGYQSLFRENLTGQAPQDYLGNLVLFLVSPSNGLLVWTPAVFVALLGLRRAWLTAPEWTRQAAVGGVAYLVVHARLNRVSGGLPFDYRYQLEPLVLATPLLVLSARSFVASHRRGLQILVFAVAASVVLQGIVAFTLDCESGTGTQAVCSLG